MIATGIQPPQETIAPSQPQPQPQQAALSEPTPEGLDIPAFLRQRQQ